jgi:hypothetical protein
MITASHVVRQVEVVFFQPQKKSSHSNNKAKHILESISMLSQQSALAARPKPKFLSFFSSPPDPVDTWSDIVRKYIAAQQPAAKRLFFDLIEDPFTQSATMEFDFEKLRQRTWEATNGLWSKLWLNLDEQVSETQMNRSQAITLRQGRSINALIEFSSSSSWREMSETRHQSAEQKNSMSDDLGR